MEPHSTSRSQTQHPDLTKLSPPSLQVPAWAMPTDRVPLRCDPRQFVAHADLSWSCVELAIAAQTLVVPNWLADAGSQVGDDL